MRISHLHRSKAIDDRTLGIIDDGRLPTLRTLVANSSLGDRVQSVVITHVLPAAIEYILTVHEVFPIKAVVAVPYSADRRAVDVLTKRGLRVVTPPSIDDMFTLPLGICLDLLMTGRA
jgi:hypothetical protein